MPKRFTDTNKWNKAWYRKLPVKLKAFWQYICDNCDSSGVWEIDYELASFQIGEDVIEIDLEQFAGKITYLGDDKLFINGFIEFQYGRLSQDCKPHIPVYKLLDKHGIEPDSVSQSSTMGKTHNISKSTRAYVIKRDGKVCTYCLKSVSNFNLVLDHVKPRINGGVDAEENLIVSCRSCNSKKSDFSLEAFVEREGLSKDVLDRVSERLSVSLEEKEQDKEKVKEQDKEKERTSYQLFVDAWNDGISDPVPKIQKLNQKRKNKINYRIAEDPDFAEKFPQIIKKINNSAFLKGDNNNSWVVNFDWVIANDSNYIKILEGNYDGKGSKPKFESAKGDENKYDNYETVHKV